MPYENCGLNNTTCVYETTRRISESRRPVLTNGRLITAVTYIVSPAVTDFRVLGS